MPRTPPSRRSAAQPAGRITWVTLLLLVAVAGGGYWLLTWAPVYYLHYGVQQVVRDYMNQAVRNPHDAELVEMMVHKIRVLHTERRPDRNGRLVAVPTVPLEAKDVTWTRDSRSQPPALHVQFEYTRRVDYPFLDRWTEATLSVDLTNDLARPDWGPER